ncbi:60S ribosomal protein L27a [Gryllus bimaculatus]|nr:60S ribosomal protein L27a [Gryllus bimaculatus]
MCLILSLKVKASDSCMQLPRKNLRRHKILFAHIILSALCLNRSLLSVFDSLAKSAWKMSTHKKKTRKLRGHVSHGHGRVGKHRKHPGGRGNAGGMHHHRINFDKYHPGYFGKLGMRNYHIRRNTKWCPTLNLDKLWTLVSEKQRLKYKADPDGKAPVIDVVRAGYYKVLGKGVLPKQPVIVKAKFFSKRAEEKIKSVGGEEKMEKNNEYWKNCVNWLVRCEVLRPDHQTLQNGAHVEDLAYTLRDGVLLCCLINILEPDCIEMQNVNLNPQTTRCLCLQNIDIFLKACHDIFAMRTQDLFESSMLFDLTGFHQVLVTLSILSNTPKARERTSYGFNIPQPDAFNKLKIGEVDIRRSIELSENASLSTQRESIRQDAIYEKLVTVKQEKSALVNKKKEKRDFIIEEIISNEKSYLQGVLKTVLESYMKPLKTILNPYDTKAIFGDLEKLTELHEDLYKDLLDALLPESELFVSEVFLKGYHRFLIYGEYCANLPRALELLKSISSNKVDVKDMLNFECDDWKGLWSEGGKHGLMERSEDSTCQAQLKKGRFFLNDMLVVPMQHVLKYRLLLERLSRETPDNHPEAGILQKAYEAMVDVNNYVNDVKRDREALQTIEKIESRIIDLRMPGSKTLKDFGRLHKDDELRIKFPDQKNGTYACQEALNLASYKVKDMQVNSRWGHHWRLIHKNERIEYVIHARNEEHKRSWMQAILEALDNIDPVGAKNNDHSFVMCTFEKPTMCHLCEKCLKGLIMQGYSCHYCKLVVHKSCIKDVDTCTASLSPCILRSELPSPPFAGVVHRKDADDVLQVRRRGTFMLRIRPKHLNNATAPERTEFAISLKTVTSVAHMLIFKKMAQGVPFYYLSEARSFPTIVELIDFYKHWPLQENYEELDEVLILPYNINSEAGISSENFNTAGEETEDENADYLDMHGAHEKIETQHDSRHVFNFQCGTSVLELENNMGIQSPGQKKSATFGYETEDDSNTSVSCHQDFVLYSPTTLNSHCSREYSERSTQTENSTVNEICEEDIEKFGEYVVAALKLFKNSHSLRELTNEIRKSINNRLDSELDRV